MSQVSISALGRIVLGGLAIIMVLVVNNAIPGLLTPTLGQAIWTTGFAQSFANQGFTSLHTEYFGIPVPGAIAFGLAGAWPTSLLLRIGLSPADAYSGMVAFWLAVAFLSAYRLARKAGNPFGIALIGALFWSTLPVIWGHASYSMLALGIALLPFYFLALVRLVDVSVGVWRARACYLLATIIAVFMDGYTFVMFAAGASLALVYLGVTRPTARVWLLRSILPLHCLSFATAYLLYIRYVGVVEFDHSPMDFFRGWGLDLSFLAIPTQGLLWAPDLMGVGVQRSTRIFYGDASTWRTTFALPLLLSAGLAFAFLRRQRALSCALLAGALLALYLALGPSLKVHSIKPQNSADQMAVTLNPLMPAEHAVAPTGSGWLSQNLPGFNAMRAAYRWSALAFFAAWCLLILQIPAFRHRSAVWALLGVLLLLNLPHPRSHWWEGADARTMFSRIDEQLRAPLAQRLSAGEKVAFVPWGNDFLANYLAPALGVRAFNVGGDKGGEQARRHWPNDLVQMSGDLSSADVSPMARLLLSGEADVVVIPYVSLLWSAHFWPCVEQAEMRLSAEQMDEARLIPNFHCPQEIRSQNEPLLRRLKALPYLKVDEDKLFAVVRLAPVEDIRHLRDQWVQSSSPVSLPAADSVEALFMLAEGWYGLEPGHVWSGARARLDLPVPLGCRGASCTYRLTMNTFAASATRPVTVSLYQTCAGQEWHQDSQRVSDEASVYAVPACSSGTTQSLWIEVKNADSPSRLQGIPDARILGVSLSGISLEQGR
jgi:hypothetical protein